ELHRLAGGQFLCAHRLLQSETAYASGRTVTTNRGRSTPFTPAGQRALLRRPARAPIRGTAMTSTDREGAARALLAFYREAGVDALLEETPTDRFASDRPSAVPAAPRAEAARAKGEASSARPGPTRERPPGSHARARAPGPGRCCGRGVTRGRRDGGARGCEKCGEPRGAARAARTLRRLRVAHDRDPARFRRRQSAGARHVRGRSAGARRGHRGPAVRRPLGQAARPDDGGDRD